MYSAKDVTRIQKQLLPTGRAFKVPENGNFEKLFDGIGEQKAVALNSAISILDSIIPDNNLFSVEDCVVWEKTLGIYADENDTLENRKSSIYRKMQFPSNIKGRQHKSYLEYQLKQAGFDCKIYEWAEVKNMTEQEQHSTDTIHAIDTEHGGINTPEYSSIVANFIDENDEIVFNPNLQDLKNCFWISGQTFGSFFELPLNRLDEFRKIILTIKPLYMVGLLRIGVVADNWILVDGTWHEENVWYDKSLWL